MSGHGRWPSSGPGIVQREIKVIHPRPIDRAGEYRAGGQVHANPGTAAHEIADDVAEGHPVT